MKILWISKYGESLDLAMRLALEGHKVIAHICEKGNRGVFEGMIQKVDDYKKYLKWCDYAVTDINDMVDVQKVMFDTRTPCFNMSYSKRSYDIGGKKFKAWEFSNLLESDREFSHFLMKRLKMGDMTETAEFTDIAKAKEFLKKREGPFVVKPESKGYIGSSLTYVGEFDNNEDTIEHLESLQYRPEVKKISKVFLEKRIKGIEVACSIWFNGKNRIGDVNINFEHKKFGAGDVGWLTGEMGTLMRYVKGNPKIYTDTLEKIEFLLRDLDFRGQLDINCIINEYGIFPLEFTPRFGYPSIHIEQEAHITSWADVLGAIATGSDCDLKVRDEWAMGVVGVGEGFPSDEEGHKRMKYRPVLHVKENIGHTHLCEMVFKDGKFMTDGAYVLVVTSHGKTVKEAQDKIYKGILSQDNDKRISFPTMDYRIDIGNKVEKQYEQLIEWGYV